MPHRRFDHTVGIEPEHRAPEQGLEDHMREATIRLARFLASDQTSPFKRFEDAGTEGRKLAPAAIVPVRPIALENPVELPFTQPVLDFDIHDVQPGVPVAGDFLPYVGIGCMVHCEQEKRHEFVEQGGRQGAEHTSIVVDLEGAFPMASEPQPDQQEMQEFERREVRFVHKPLMPEDLSGRFPRPVEVLHGSMNEVALEGLGRGEADISMPKAVIERQPRRPQQGRQGETG